MSYRIDVTRPIDEEVRRVARDEVGRALKEIEDPQIDAGKTVHQVRKRCKRLRALLKLVRDAAPGLYRRENQAFRDTARTIAAARDGDVLIETFDSLAETGPSEPTLGGEMRLKLRKVLVDGRNASLAEAGQLDEQLREVGQHLRAAEERIDTWALPDRGFETIAPGLERCYQRARSAMKQALEKPSSERLHEWRKQTKNHRYQVRLLRGLWEPVLEARRSELHRLTDLLGEDHDLAVLWETLVEEAGGDDPIAGLPAVLERIRARRAELQAGMPPLGRRLFADKPGAFIRRMSTYHEAAAAEGG